MVLLGQLMAFTPCSEQHQERNRAVFYHEGNKISKNTFLFLHNIGNFHLKALKEHLYSKGLVPRIHGHSSRTAPNALVLEDVRSIISFILEYTEAHGILLPGRIPVHKRDDIQLLPSSTTKRAVWEMFQNSSTATSTRAVSYPTFCKVWKKFVGHIIVSKPMTDLCAVCQKNSVTILWSANLNEDQQQRYTHNNTL